MLQRPLDVVLEGDRRPRAIVGSMSARAKSLEEELAQLTCEERAWVEADLALRARAEALSARLGLDQGDVYHQLKQLMRSPSERLRLGLSHGRLRRRIPE